jgi:hypothetical protein
MGLPHKPFFFYPPAVNKLLRRANLVFFLLAGAGDFVTVSACSFAASSSCSLI